MESCTLKDIFLGTMTAMEARPANRVVIFSRPTEQSMSSSDLGTPDIQKFLRGISKVVVQCEMCNYDKARCFLHQVKVDFMPGDLGRYTRMVNPISHAAGFAMNPQTMAKMCEYFPEDVDTGRPTPLRTIMDRTDLLIEGPEGGLIDLKFEMMSILLRAGADPVKRHGLEPGTSMSECDLLLLTPLRIAARSGAQRLIDLMVGHVDFSDPAAVSETITAALECQTVETANVILGRMEVDPCELFGRIMDSGRADLALHWVPKKKKDPISVTARVRMFIKAALHRCMSCRRNLIMRACEVCICTREGLVNLLETNHGRPPTACLEQVAGDLEASRIIAQHIAGPMENIRGNAELEELLVQSWRGSCGSETTEHEAYRNSLVQIGINPLAHTQKWHETLFELATRLNTHHIIALGSWFVVADAVGRVLSKAEPKERPAYEDSIRSALQIMFGNFMSCSVMLGYMLSIDGMAPFMVEKDGRSFIEIAVLAGRIDMVNIFIPKYAGKPAGVEDLKAYRGTDFLLTRVCRRSSELDNPKVYIKTIKRLLCTRNEKKMSVCDVNETGPDGETPLQAACTCLCPKGKCMDLIALLLSKGAKIDMGANWLLPRWALEHDRPDILTALVSTPTPLPTVWSRLDGEIVYRIMDHIDDLISGPGENEYKRWVKPCEALILRGAVFLVPKRATLLHSACNDGFETVVVEYLLNHGCDKFIRTPSRRIERRPLWFAVHDGNVETCKLLLRRGASIYDATEETPGCPVLIDGVDITKTATEQHAKFVDENLKAEFEAASVIMAAKAFASGLHQRLGSESPVDLLNGFDWITKYICQTAVPNMIDRPDPELL